jgi:hypothetical protein
MSLLRKTRFQSLLEGDAKKLSVFLIAELVLITLGMSIALQFDQWKEHQDKLDKEIVLLQQLYLEFEEAESAVNAGIMELDSLDKPRLKLYRNCGNNQDAMSEMELLEIVATTYSFSILPISNGVLTDAINSGKFTLINNDTLRTILSSWEDKLGSVFIFNHHVNERTEDYYVYSFNFVAFKDLDNKSYPDLNLSKSTLSTGGLKILNDRVFENQVGDVFYQGRAAKKRYQEQLLEPVREILEILKREIELKTN